ncbi:MAG: hypothetical protein UW68_C0046G0003 [Candidatus Collierbacteria bacterium GW2011_GWB1_44_6]|uniref:Uncharacterized protein n=1 Tax=Candidatus Collierbacteria bacterium GW2011_GWB1_44_6 TaxID=1618384 RepID=A0A0G1JLC5_9BACT|nr:MAG: hypothetical protein UW68_C0046G0003 [Candidatus Collierbacteria bacterium GW2011_GWB1_44_6]
MYNNEKALVDCERDRENDKTDIQDEIQEDTTSMEEKLEALDELEKSEVWLDEPEA